MITGGGGVFITNYVSSAIHPSIYPLPGQSLLGMDSIAACPDSLKTLFLSCSLRVALFYLVMRPVPRVLGSEQKNSVCIKLKISFIKRTSII